ncbi:hypothetical protein CMI38_03915 [Candidatus Pacearchaeota archaeon]|jgi:hypothetical protein|nr:hypothetical protein [Candidatus Pacearchaeota archaeon]|tara:strand:+ start:6339 stop:7250 length:912 start_codon:yes stop_codon:yes gene_type:complete
MTVINMLSFGETGVAVADEQASLAVRKFNFAKKLHELDETTIFAGAGSLYYMMNVYDRVKDSMKGLGDDYLLSHLHGSVVDSIIDYNKQLRETALQSSFGIGMDDFSTGTHLETGRPLEDQMKSMMGNRLSKIEESNHGNAILLGGIENGKFEIYIADYSGNASKVYIPHQSIGSGAEESERILFNYSTLLSREGREKIDPKEGLVKVIEATNSSARMNQGVGGTISIAYVTSEGIKNPTENDCRLASEIVEAHSLDLLGKNPTYNFIDRIILNGNSENVKGEFKSEIKDWDSFNEHLRGYKH